MQLTSGVDVFAHVCGQKADTSSNYCDNIQPYDKKRFRFFSNPTRLLDCFFVEITTNSNKLSKGSAATYWRYGGKYYIGFVALLEIYFSFQQRKNFENPLPLRINEVIAMSLVYYFIGTRYISMGDMTPLHPRQHC